MKRLALALLLLALAAWPAHAQPVTVIGPITPGDCALFNSTTILKDAGFACNGSSGPVVFGPATSNVGDVAVFNNTTGNSLADVKVWGAVAPVGGLPLFAAPTATGTGSCLSSGNACALATACSFVTQIATFLGQASPINLANGTYTNPGCNVQGEAGGNSIQLVSLLGNCSSPSSVIIALSGGAAGITGQDHATIGVNCMQFQSSGTGGTGIFCRQQSICDYSNILWATWGTGGAHVSIDESRVNTLSASGGCETLLANFNVHWNMAGQGAHLAPGCATSIPSAVSWSAGGNGFVSAAAGFIDLTGWSTTGSGVAGSTGQPANLNGTGYMITAAAALCAAVIPGNTACNFSLGFQDNAGEGMTGTGILVGQSQPTVDAEIVKARTFAGLPASPTAGQISHIIDGLAANCGDGACKLPNTTVTGGGGSLDLLVGWDGAAWRIFRAASAYATTGTGALVFGTAPTITLTNATGLPVAGGGTGNATAAAHSIPVSEGTSAQNAVGPCATNQVIVGGGASADPACGLNTAGAWINLATLTASNSASLSDTTHITGTYTSYVLVFQNILPATNERIMEFQVHSGGSFQTSGYNALNILAANSSVGSSVANTAAYIPLTHVTASTNQSMGNIAPGYSATIFLTNPAANQILNVTGQFGYWGGGGAGWQVVGQVFGAWSTAGVVDGFRVQMDSGNITSGSIIIYGVL